jgi:hypothetical protein
MPNASVTLRRLPFRPPGRPGTLPRAWFGRSGCPETPFHVRFRLPGRPETLPDRQTGPPCLPGKHNPQSKIQNLKSEIRDLKSEI